LRGRGLKFEAKQRRNIVLSDEAFGGDLGLPDRQIPPGAGDQLRTIHARNANKKSGSASSRAPTP
jgi:hypothetical protein